MKLNSPLKHIALNIRRRQVRKYKRLSCKADRKDWLVPLKHNMWVQLGISSSVAAVVQTIRLYWSFTALGLAIDVFLILAAILMLGGTEFGHGTVKSYRRTRQLLDRPGGDLKFDVRLQRKLSEKLYCYRAGTRIAAVEKGLSGQLIPKLANWWRPW